MQLGMIGLGCMDENMTERCMRGGHKMLVYATDEEAVKKYASMGAVDGRQLKIWSAKSQVLKPSESYSLPARAPKVIVNQLDKLLGTDDIIGAHFRSRKEHTFSEKMFSPMRQKFAGTSNDLRAANGS